MKNEAIAERIEYLTNAMVDRIDMVTSLELALGRTSKALGRARIDERLLVDRVHNLEEQGLRMSVLVKRVADSQRMAMNTNKELVLSMQRNDVNEKELNQIRVSMETCFAERDLLQNTTRDQEVKLQTLRAESKSALASAAKMHAVVVKELQESVRSLEDSLKSQHEDSRTKRDELTKDLDAAQARSKVHEVENESLRDDNLRLEKSLCDFRDKIAKFEASTRLQESRAAELHRTLEESREEGRVALNKALEANERKVNSVEGSAKDLQRAAEAEKHAAVETQARLLKEVDSIKGMLCEIEREREHLQSSNNTLREEKSALEARNTRLESSAVQRELHIAALEKSTENSGVCQSLRDKIAALNEDVALQQDDLEATASYCQKLQTSNAALSQRIENFESLERARATSATRSSATQQDNILLQQQVEASDRKLKDLETKCREKDDAMDELRYLEIAQAAEIADNAAAYRQLSEKLSSSRVVEGKCIALEKVVGEQSTRIDHLERRECFLLAAVRSGTATSEILRRRIDRQQSENDVLSQRILHYRSCAAQLQKTRNNEFGADDTEVGSMTVWQLEALREYCERLEKKQDFLGDRVESLDEGQGIGGERNHCTSSRSNHDTQNVFQLACRMEVAAVDPPFCTVTSRSTSASSKHDAMLRQCKSIENETGRLEVRLNTPRHVPLSSSVPCAESEVISVRSSTLNPRFRIVSCAATQWSFEPSIPSGVPAVLMMSPAENDDGQANRSRSYLDEPLRKASLDGVISAESEDSEMSVQPSETLNTGQEKGIFTSSGVDIASSQEAIAVMPEIKSGGSSNATANCVTCAEAATLRQRSTICIALGVNMASSVAEITDKHVDTEVIVPSASALVSESISFHQSDLEASTDTSKGGPQDAPCSKLENEKAVSQERCMSVTTAGDLGPLRHPSSLCSTGGVNIFNSSPTHTQCSISGVDVVGSVIEKSITVLSCWGVSPSTPPKSESADMTPASSTELKEVEEALSSDQEVPGRISSLSRDKLCSGRSTGEGCMKYSSSRDTLQNVDTEDGGDHSDGDERPASTSSRSDCSGRFPSHDSESAESHSAASKGNEPTNENGRQPQHCSKGEVSVYEDQILRLLDGHEQLELRVSNYQIELTALQKTADVMTMERNAYLSQAEKLAVELGRMSMDCDMINRTLVWMREAHLEHVEGVATMESALVLQLISSEMERLKEEIRGSSSAKTERQPQLQNHSTFSSRIASDIGDRDLVEESSPVTVSSSTGGWSPFGFGRQARKNAPAADTLKRDKSVKQDAVWNAKPDWNVSDDYTEIAL